MQLCSQNALMVFLLTFSIACSPKDETPENPTPDDVPTTPKTASGPSIHLTGEGNEFNSRNPKLASSSDGVTSLVFQQCLFGDTCNKKTIVASKQNADHTFSSPTQISPVGDGSANQNADRYLYLVRVTQGTVSGEPVAINEAVDGQNPNTNDSDSGTFTLINGNVLRTCWQEKDPSPTAADLDIFCAWRTL